MPRPLIFLVLTMLTADTSTPWIGVWRLNSAKSTVNNDSRFKRVTLKIDGVGDSLKVIYDMVGVRGGVNHIEWVGALDGKDYPVQGLDYVMTNAYTKLSDRSYRIDVKADGVPVASTTVVVSEDGKTLESVTSEKRERGETVSSKSVYDRLQ
jgi:hypothetical protein